MRTLCTVLVLFVLVGSRGGWAQEVGAKGAADTLSLAAALDLALDQNFDARIARDEAAIAANDFSLGNAGFLPRLTASGSTSQTIGWNEQVIGGTRREQSGAVTTNYRASAEARWTLFDGLGRFAAYDRLEAERDVRQAAAREQVELVAADVITAYYDVARLQQQRTVFEEAVAISRERVRIAELRKDLGSASDLEVRQARVDLNTDRADLLRTDVTLASARAGLNRLLGRTESGPAYRVSESVSLDTTLVAQTVREAAARQSPALRQARRAVDAADEAASEVRSERLPSVDVFAGFDYSRLEGGTGVFEFSDSRDVRYGASLTFTVFDGFNRKRRIENADVRTRIAEYRLDDARARLTAAVLSTYESYRNRLRLVDLEAENLTAAQANVDVALERFRLGTITSVELREVQEQLIRAESRLLDARFEAKRAETELVRLSGQLLRP